MIPYKTSLIVPVASLVVLRPPVCFSSPLGERSREGSEFSNIECEKQIEAFDVSSLHTHE
jgi:hypothetical protein